MDGANGGGSDVRLYDYADTVSHLTTTQEVIDRITSIEERILHKHSDDAEDAASIANAVEAADAASAAGVVNDDDDESGRSVPLVGLTDIGCLIALKGLTGILRGVITYDDESEWDLFNIEWLTTATTEERVNLKESAESVTKVLQSQFIRVQESEEYASADDAAALKKKVNYRLRRIMRHVNNCGEVIEMSIRMAQNTDPSQLESSIERDQALDDVTSSCFAPARDDYESDFQFLCVAIAHIAQQKGVGHRGGFVYDRHRHPVTNHLTYAWSCREPIEKWIFSVTRRRNSEEVWRAFTGKGQHLPYKNLGKYLQNGIIPEFPMVEPDRHVFAFRNGLYFAMEDRFHPYSDGAVAGFPPPIAAKYHDFDVPLEWFHDPKYMNDPLEIETPWIDKVFAHQGFHATGESAVVYLTVLGLLGRTIYEIGERDNWQIVPFLMGFAGTGKSAIIDLCKSIYVVQDQGIISNNIEEKFGVSYLDNCFVAYATEVKRDFRLDQADFQSMITGESVSMPVKNGDVKVKDKWTAPLLLAGNEMMNMSDNAGSLARRLVAIYFETVVMADQIDDRISENAKREIAGFIVKINRSYQRMLRDYGTRSFWSACPKEFRENRTRIEATLNPLSAFLQSEEITFGEDKSVEESAFKAALRTYCQASGCRSPQWNADLFKAPFAQRGLKREQVKVTSQRGRTSDQTHIHGCTLSCILRSDIASAQAEEKSRHVQQQRVDRVADALQENDHHDQSEDVADAVGNAAGIAIDISSDESDYDSETDDDRARPEKRQRDQ